uniref:Receptor for retinol uptake STRA6 n=1 Tax=Oryzias latipes TaxID=8090 RepID=A0A3P9LMV3_ORYLA
MNHSNAEIKPFEYSYYDYDSWYNNAEPTKPPKEVILPCNPTADDKLFHICILSISLVIMLILAALTRKNKFCQGFARASSTNFLDQTQEKGVVVAVFGMIFSKIAMVVIAPDPLPFCQDTPAGIKEYMKIVAIFYYPVLYYPLLVCGTLQRKSGFVFGTLLSLSHFGVVVWQKFDCPKTPEIYKYYNLLASLPHLACLAYLCVKFPLLFFKGPENDEVGSRQKFQQSDLCCSSCLTEQRGLVLFRYPLKLAVSVLCFTLQMTLLLVVLVVPTLHIVRAGIDENIAFLLLGFGIILSDDRMEVVKIVTFYTWLLEVCYICATTLSCLISLFMLMKSMLLHRSNLKSLYKGEIYYINNSQKTIRPSYPGVVCWMGLTGYQAAVVCLGMAIQTLVFFICFLFLVFLIIVPIFYGRNIIVFEIAGKAWPAWITLILVSALQHVTAKLFFIKKESGTRDLNNRYFSLFLLTYLMFVVNIVVGLVVVIWRVVITALYNIIHLARIDISLLHRSAESSDPAYSYYTHFLNVEVSQSHPVMKAFCGLLLDVMIEGGRAGQKQSAEEGIHQNSTNKKTRSRRICFRWQLLYTLVNNPSLLGSRKHFQTLQMSENVLNGTPKRSSRRESKKEAEAASEEAVESMKTQ